MSKGQKTQQTTQATNFPSWIEDSQHNLHDRTREYFDAQLKSGGANLAPLTPTQQQAGTIMSGMAGASGDEWAQKIAGAGQVDPAEITGLMSPYLDSVGNDTLNAMSRERSNRDAEIGARNASAVAFGGSGAALERAQLNRGHGEQVGTTINSLLAQGHDRATALAQSNANNELSAMQGAAGAASDAFGNRLNAVGSLLNYGGLEQSQKQAEQDRMSSLLQWYGSTIPGYGSTTVSTAPDNSPSLLQQIIGGALTIGGMGVGGPAGAAGGTLLGNFLGGK